MNIMKSEPKNQKNAQNIKSLEIDRDRQRELMNEGEKYFTEVRNSIQKIDQWGAGIDTYLRRATDMSFGPIGKDWKSETAALINYYTTLFTEQNRILRLLEKEFKLGKVSEALLELSNETLWDEPAARWSTLHACNLKVLNDTVHLQLNFNMPIKDSSMTVVKAVAIPLYNRTQRVDKNIC